MTGKEKNFNDFKKQTIELTILEQMSALAKEIELDFVGIETSLDIFPSGAAMLDIRLNNNERVFVMDYSPTYHLFSIDELGGENEGFNTGYTYNVEDFYVATEILYKLINSDRTK